jgi:hypothetical protein
MSIVCLIKQWPGFENAEALLVQSEVAIQGEEGWCMNFPIVLDIALGLVFVFFALSLLASEIQEIIGTLLQWRAEHLKRSIEVLFSGNEPGTEKLSQDLADALYNSPWIRSLNQEAKGRIARGLRQITHLMGKGYRVLTGTRNVFGEGKTSGPSYIPAEAFANSLLERMQLGNLWQLLADERLNTFIDNNILLPVNDILNDLKASTDNEFLLNPELKRLEKAAAEILEDFHDGRVNLPETLDRLADKLDDFANMARDILPDNHHLTETFLRRLTYIKRAIVSISAERAALLSKLHPTMEQLLAVFEDGSLTQKELIVLAQKGSKPAQDLLGRLGGQTITPALRESLSAIARKLKATEAAVVNEVQQFSYEIEKWFDRSMERATGVYKRNAKAVALLIGIGTAVAINADAFHISSRLVKDPVLRNSITQVAEQTVVDPAGDMAANFEQVQDAVNEALQGIPFPLGYGEVVLEQQQEAEREWPVPLVQRRFLGWLVSGFAISMGSTFWFELLKKIVNVRNSGGKDT